jgi:hypothetical protein
MPAGSRIERDELPEDRDLDQEDPDDHREEERPRHPDHIAKQLALVGDLQLGSKTDVAARSSRTCSGSPARTASRSTASTRRHGRAASRSAS